MSEAAFPNTSWSTVLTARAGGDTADAQTALARLCQQYWYPLYAFARRWGLAPEDAEDATQDFFAALTTADLLASVDPGRGKLKLAVSIFGRSTPVEVEYWQVERG